MDYKKTFDEMAAAINDMSASMTLYLDTLKGQDTKAEKDDVVTKTSTFFQLLTMDSVTANNIAGYIVNVIEAVAGGSTAANDVLNDITGLASKYGYTLPPMIVGMLGGLLTQAEVSIQQYHSGK